MLKEILERIKPYDEITPKEDFLKLFDSKVFFRKIESKLFLNESQDWREQAKKQQVYFTIYDNRWKVTSLEKNLKNKPSVQFTFVGPEKSPAISVVY